MWRQVDCGYTPDNPAPIYDTTMYASALPDSSQDLHRTVDDWTGDVLISASMVSWCYAADFRQICAYHGYVENPL